MKQKLIFVLLGLAFVALPQTVLSWGCPQSVNLIEARKTGDYYIYIGKVKDGRDYSVDKPRTVEILQTLIGKPPTAFQTFHFGPTENPPLEVGKSYLLTTAYKSPEEYNTTILCQEPRELSQAKLEVFKIKAFLFIADKLPYGLAGLLAIVILVLITKMLKASAKFSKKALTILLVAIIIYFAFFFGHGTRAVLHPTKGFGLPFSYRLDIYSEIVLPGDNDPKPFAKHILPWYLVADKAIVIALLLLLFSILKRKPS